MPKKNIIIDKPKDIMIISGANPNSNEFQNSNFKIKYTIPEIKVNNEKINPIKDAILIGVFELLIIPTSAISNKVKKLFFV